MASATLEAKGWFLTDEGIEICKDGGNKKDDKIIEAAKDTDLKQIGKKWLPDEVNKGSCEYVKGPGVLQIQKIRNIAAPKDNEESQGAPRLLKMTFTDGHLSCNAVEVEKLDKFGLDIPPGTKVLLKGTVGVEHGFLLLNNKNCQLIGGRVEKMAESWELKKMLSKQSKQRGTTEGGPPPFVPFGHRIQENKTAPQRDSFKSLNTKKEEKKEEGEFEQQRKAIIAEALQTKEEKTKTFGGGQKQLGTDQDIARLMEMGFSAEQAGNALNKNNGNFQLAVNFLLQGKGGTRQFGGGADRNRDIPSRGRDNQGRQPREDRRENRGRRQRDEEIEEVSTKPSAPATLFDFLSKSNKIPVENNSSKENKDTKDAKSNSNVPSKPMQYSRDDNRQSDKGYKPKYQDVSSNFSRQDSQNDRKNFDNRPKSSPAYNSQKSSNFENKSQRNDSAYDRNKQQQNYNDKGRDNRTQQNYNDRGRDNRSQPNTNDRNRNDRSQKGDGYSNDRRQNSRNDTASKNGPGGYDKRAEQDRRPNYNERNFQDDRRSNSDRNDRPKKFDKKPANDKQQNCNDQGSQSGGRFNQNGGENRNFQNNNQRPDQRDNYSRNNQQRDQPKESYREKSQNTKGGYQGQGSYNNSRTTKDSDYPPISSLKITDQAPSVVWNTGDHCLAKYWEDNQYYHAVINKCTPSTAVVLFPDYGNYEEVNLTDIKPLRDVPLQVPDFSVPPPGMFGYNMPPPGNQPTTNAIPPMEFRRKKPENDKPTMQYYQPPKQRFN